MSSSDIAISVRGLSKSYTIAHNEAKHSTLAETMLHRLKNPMHRATKETFWALKDVSFEVKRGEVVGIIGRNGAGKSTLLKVLSRITEPTAGEVELRGRVGSLLEVGTGFHPELTGRENVYLNGAILGMRKADIRKQFDAIVDFAGVEQFLDTPVKRYSSGMYVRLAFGVAAHLEPEILVVDEVLAVGDAEFQQKCLGKINDVAKHGRTVLFVSHNSLALSGLCKRGVVLQKGQLHADFPIEDALKVYSKLTAVADGGIVLRSSPDLIWRGFQKDPGASTISIADDLSFSMLFESGENAIRDMEIDIGVVNSRGQMVVHARTDVVHPLINMPARSRLLAEFNIEEPRLFPGQYTLTVFARNKERELYWAEGTGNFNVAPQTDFGSTSTFMALRGLVLPRFSLKVVPQ